MRIYYRGSHIYKCLQFIILNTLGFYIENSILLERKIFKISNFLLFAEAQKIFLGLALLAMVALLRVSRSSLYFLFGLGVYYFYTELTILTTDFNKLTLVFSSIFLILYYYFLSLLKEKLNAAYLRPFFLKTYVGGKPELELRATIQGASSKVAGVLANWDEEGCFLYLDEPFESSDKSLWVDFPFESTHFQDKAIIARLSRNRREIGLRIYSNKDLSNEKKFKWKSYIKILEDRGFMPSRLK